MQLFKLGAYSLVDPSHQLVKESWPHQLASSQDMLLKVAPAGEPGQKVMRAL